VFALFSIDGVVCLCGRRNKRGGDCPRENGTPDESTKAKIDLNDNAICDIDARNSVAPAGPTSTKHYVSRWVFKDLFNVLTAGLDAHHSIDLSEVLEISTCSYSRFIFACVNIKYKKIKYV
jgi:hypothetical protein